MTLDNIRNVEFSRGRGYRAEEVDDFIDECAETVESLLREKEELNQKMKVLADKLVEYRNDEDSIRAALLNAQRTGDTVVRDAERQAEEIRAKAQREADDILRTAMNRIDAEKQELDRVKQEVTSFKARLMALYKEHLECIQQLPAEEAAPTAAEETAPAEEAASEAEENVVVAPAPEEDTMVAEEPVEEQAVSRFSNLKFGNDYDIRNDEDDEEDDAPRGLFKKRK